MKSMWCVLSELFPYPTKVPSPSQLHPDVRMAFPDPEELLPGSEGAWICAPGMETSEDLLTMWVWCGRSLFQALKGPGYLPLGWKPVRVY